MVFFTIGRILSTEKINLVRRGDKRYCDTAFCNTMKSFDIVIFMKQEGKLCTTYQYGMVIEIQ